MTSIEVAAAGALVFFPAVMIYSALVDLTSMTIPNRLVLVLVGGFAVLAPLAGFGWPELGASLAIAAAVLLLTFTLFSFGWIGGGDAKLAAATALWLGVDHTFSYVVYTMLFGGLLAVALLLFRCLSLPDGLQRRTWVVRLHSPQTGVPYGVAMAPAALVVFPNTPWLMAFA